jgi:hypothetical protein
MSHSSDESPVLDSSEAIRGHLADSLEPWERGRRSIRFVLCDGENRVRAHCPVDGMPAQPEPDACRRAVSVFANALAEGETPLDTHTGGRHSIAAPRSGAMLVVLTRPGPATVADSERRWFHAAHEGCAEHRVRLLGVYLLTPGETREVVLDDAL